MKVPGAELLELSVPKQENTYDCGMFPSHVHVLIFSQYQLRFGPGSFFGETDFLKKTQQNSPVKDLDRVYGLM